MRSSYSDLIKLYVDREYNGKVINLNNVSHSRIRGLEIIGETTEVGEGEKSSTNPYTFKGCENPMLNICKENVANCNNVVYNSVVRDVVTTTDSVTLTKRDTSSTGGANGFYGVLINVKPNTKYFVKKPTLSPEKSNGVKSAISVCLYSKKPNGSNISVAKEKHLFDLSDSLIIQTKNNINWLGINVQLGAKYAATAVLSDVMVSMIDLPYVPYAEQTLTVPYILNGIPVLSGGNYTDKNGQQWICDTYNPLSGEFVQRVGKITLDGTENWSDVYYSNLGFFQLHIGEMSSNSNVGAVMSDRWITKSTGYKYANAMYKQSGYSVLRISPSTDLVTNLADFKAFLSENNTIVYYELAQHVVTDIDVPLFKANIPCTNIYLDEPNGLGNIKATLQTKE